MTLRLTPNKGSCYGYTHQHLFHFDGELDPACRHGFLLLQVQFIIKRFSLTLIKTEMFEPKNKARARMKMVYSSSKSSLTVYIRKNARPSDSYIATTSQSGKPLAFMTPLAHNIRPCKCQSEILHFNTVNGGLHRDAGISSSLQSETLANGFYIELIYLVRS